jgi:hypothetical protein
MDNYYIRVIKYSPEQKEVLERNNFEFTKKNEMIFVTTNVNEWSDTANWLQRFEDIKVNSGGCVNDDYIAYLKGLFDPRD